MCPGNDSIGHNEIVWVFDQDKNKKGKIDQLGKIKPEPQGLQGIVFSLPIGLQDFR